MNLHATGKLIP